VWVVRSLRVAAEGQIHTLADLKLLMAGPCFAGLLQLFGAYLSIEGRPLDALDALRQRCRQVPPEQVEPEPLVTGDDLLAMDVPQGPAFTTILAEVYYRQLNLEFRDRDAALRWAARLAGTALTRPPEP
jgi:poly(A) polymerase